LSRWRSPRLSGRRPIRHGRCGSSSVSLLELRPISSRGSSARLCRSGSASNSSSKTGPAPAAISGPKTSGAINATLYSNLGFSFVRDVAPVAMIGLGPFVMVVNPKLPTRTVPEFIAYAKANSGKISMASQGTGLASHLMGEFFKMMAGVNLVHVPYSGSFTADLLSGQMQVAFVPITNVIEYIRDGRLRPLAVTIARRAELLPDVPAMSQFLPRYDA